MAVIVRAAVFESAEALDVQNKEASNKEVGSQ
jgi:hypothetical protein